MTSDVSSTISLAVSLAAVLIALASALIQFLQFRKRRAFVWTLNSEQVQQTIAVPYADAPTQVHERYPQFDDEHPAVGGGYVVFANAGDRTAFVMLKHVAVTPTFIRVARYPALAVPPGEIVRQELFVHNIPLIAPDDRLRITIRVGYYWIEASRGRAGRMRKHDGEATLHIDALRSYPTEEV